MKAIAALLSGFLAMGVLALGSVGVPGAVAGDLDSAALAEEVLRHASIRLRPAARLDVEHGLVDARVLAVLVLLAERHELTSVGPLVSAHSYYVKGTTRPSNHSFGRAVDITAIDGSPVSVQNTGALDAVQLLVSLDPPLSPDEIGAPWPLRFARISTFTKEHGDHLHVGFSALGSPDR